MDGGEKRLTNLMFKMKNKGLEGRKVIEHALMLMGLCI